MAYTLLLQLRVLLKVDGSRLAISVFTCRPLPNRGPNPLARKGADHPAIGERVIRRRANDLSTTIAGNPRRRNTVSPGREALWNESKRRGSKARANGADIRIEEGGSTLNVWHAR